MYVTSRNLHSETRKVRVPVAQGRRFSRFFALFTFVLAASLLAHSPRIEAQVATSIEIVATAYTSDTIAVQLDASGNPAILFGGRKATCTDPNCNFPFIEIFFEDYPNRKIETLDVGFDAQGFPYLLFGSKYASNRFPNTMVRCLDLDCNNVITHDSPGRNMALRNDRLAMVTYQNAGTDKLKLAHCVNLECTSRNMIRTIAEDGLPAAIDVDNDGNPIILYSLDGQVGWSIARCYDVVCSAPVVTPIDLSGRVDHVSIEVNGSDEPVLSFRNEDSFRDRSLKVLLCDDPNCEASSTRTIDNAGVAADMQLDESGYPVLAYRKSGTIRLARCQDDACATLSVEVVDEGTGRTPTLILDELSHPVLAYRARGSLKLARCGNPGCLATDDMLPNPGSYNLRSVATGRYLDADRNGAVGTSFVPRPDDVWNLDLAISNASLPFKLANREYTTPIERSNWILEDAGDGTYYVRRLSTATQNYLTTSGRSVLLTTLAAQSDRWEFIPVD